jgi:outer membrane lipoprotein-sorting protein
VKATVLEAGRPAGDATFELSRKGPDRSLAVFTAGKQKGRRILTAGDRTWLLVPGSSRAVPISANQKLIGGASMGDVARIRFADAFTATVAPQPEIVDGLPCDVLELRAKQPGAAYASGTLWVDRRDHLPRRARLLLASGKPARELIFEAYGRQEGAPVLTRLTVVDLLSTKKRLETRLEFSDLRRADLPDALFTPEGAMK